MKNSKQDKSEIKDPYRWRDLTAYWILGLCNNYGYVVMLSAAHDIIGRFSGGGVSRIEFHHTDILTNCALGYSNVRIFSIHLSSTMMMMELIQNQGEFAISFRPVQFYWQTSCHRLWSNRLYRFFHFSYSKLLHICSVLSIGYRPFLCVSCQCVDLDPSANHNLTI